MLEYSNLQKQCICWAHTTERYGNEVDTHPPRMPALCRNVRETTKQLMQVEGPKICPRVCGAHEDDTFLDSP